MSRSSVRVRLLAPYWWYQMDTHLKKPVFTGFFDILGTKIFSVKPWMLFPSFHRKEGVEPYTTKNYRTDRQTLSRFRSEPADLLWKNMQKVSKAVLSNITKCDQWQNGLFSFLRKGCDTNVADILLKTIRTEECQWTIKLVINANLLRRESVRGCCTPQQKKSTKSDKKEVRYGAFCGII